MTTHTRAELKKKVLEIVNTPPPQSLEDAFMDMPEAFAAAHKRGTAGETGFAIPGFGQLSKATGGLRHKGFSIICGPTGAGKTTLLANLWIQFSAMRMPIFTAPVENGKEDFVDMLASIVSKKNRLDMTANAWAEIRTKYGPTFFGDRHHVFSNHESRVSHLDLLTDIYYAYLTRGTKIALCDNWQFMLDTKGSKDREYESDKALHETIVFTKHVPVHIFMVMHPKKTEHGRVESEFDIKGSSNSVQEAHNVWLFNRLKDAKSVPDSPLYSMTPDFCREITVRKARYNGRSVGTTIIYSLDPVCELYTEYKNAGGF